MPSRIDKLTKAQEAAMPAYSQKWIEIGLKTGDADWDTFEKNIKICYEKSGLKLPSRIVRVPSPFYGAHVASVAHEIWNARYNGEKSSVDDSVDASVDDSVRASVRASVDDSVRASVDASVRASVGASVRASVGASVDDSVDASVRASVRDSVDDSVRASVDASVRASVRASVGASVDASVDDSVDDSVRASVDASVCDSQYENAIIKSVIAIAEEYKVQRSWNYWMGGQFWVGYYWRGVAFCNFFFDICGLKLSKDIMERAAAYRKVCESVNYMWLNRDFILVCDRPKRISRNAEGRLHSTTEKAIEYKDGWGLYMIHGVKFTEEQFKKAQTATVAEVIAWEDIDQRSALLRERPIETLLEHIPKKVIDHTDECGGYDLVEIEMPGDKKARILSYKSWSSDKRYVKFVPLTSTNALETVASLRHQTVAELKSSQRS